MAEISRLMAVRPPTLVYVIDGLIAKCLVTRAKDTRDRRRQPLALAVKGKKLLANFSAMDADSILVRSLLRMTAKQRLDLRTLLAQLASGLGESPLANRSPESTALGLQSVRTKPRRVLRKGKKQ